MQLGNDLFLVFFSEHKSVHNNKIFASDNSYLLIIHLLMTNLDTSVLCTNIDALLIKKASLSSFVYKMPFCPVFRQAGRAPWHLV